VENPFTNVTARTIGFALAALAVLSLFTILATLFGLASPGLGPLPLIGALVPVVVLRRKLDERALLGVCAGLGAAGAIAALAGAAGLSDAVVRSHWKCGTPDAALVLFLPVVGVCATGMAAALAWVLARWVWLALRTLAPVAAVVTLVGATLLVATTIGGVFDRPAPDAWALTLPVAGVLEAPKPDQPCTVPPPPDARPITMEPPYCAYEPVEVAGVTVERACEEPKESSRRSPPCVVRAKDGWTTMASIERDQVLELRTRPDLGVVVLTSGWHVLGAIDRTTGHGRDVTLREVAGEVRVADKMLIPLGPGGLLAFLLAVVAGRRAARRVFGASPREATLDDKGWVAFDDGTTVRPDTSALSIHRAPGPVLVWGKAGSAGYREGMRAPLRLEPGTLDAWRAAAIAEETWLWLGSFCAAAIAIAPYLLAWFVGLVR
jgi:hypothetical protein